ncbi:hypothetical protein P879_01464 [Paragonimus westermani]|uniref:Protein-tyrosine-phosphatase n=1 Tax=Paragonimus westermani TaxID=34504 RepID=A0A8T0DQC8_9TREM|nr:hypothetical protein P879_01464 [Paragonimus westermani]
MCNGRTCKILSTLLFVRGFLFNIHVLGQTNGYAPKNSVGLEPQEIGSDYVTVKWTPIPSEDVIYLSYKLLNAPPHCKSPVEDSNISHVNVSSNFSTSTFNVNHTRIRFWMSTENYTDTLPVTIGTVQIDESDSYLKSAMWRADEWQITTTSSNVDPIIIGLFHDGCGNCSAMLLSDVSASHSTSADLLANWRKKLCFSVDPPSVRYYNLTTVNESLILRSLDSTQSFDELSHILTFRSFLKNETNGSLLGSNEDLMDFSKRMTISGSVTRSGPESLKVENRMIGAQVVVWSAPAGNPSDVIGYEIVQVGGHGSVNISKEIRSYLFFALEPCKTYIYNVCAIYSTPPSQCSSIRQQAFCSMPNAPQNVRITSHTADSTKVEWDAPLEAFGLNVSEYLLIVQIISSNLVQTVNYTVPNSSRTFTLSTNPCTTYLVCVHAVDQRHKVKSDSSRTLTVISNANEPDAPQNLRLSQLDANGVTVQWEYAQLNSTGFNVSKFIVIASTPSQIANQVTASVDVLEPFTARLTLEQCTAYSIHVVAWDESLDVRSDPSTYVKATTLAKVPGQLISLFVTNVRPGVQRLSWTRPNVKVVCSHTYVIMQTRNGSGAASFFQAASSESSHIFPQLSHRTTYGYTIHVVSQPGDVHGPISAFLTLETMSSKPDAPQNLRLSQLDANGVTVQWEYAQLNSTGFNVSKFIVIASTPSQIANQVTASVDVLEPFTARLTLEQCTAYSIHVVAWDESLDVRSDPSTYVKATTLAKEPDVPQKMAVVLNTKSEQTVQWDPPSVRVPCQHQYELNRYGSNDNLLNIVYLPANVHNYTFSGLSGSQTFYYTVRVVAQPGDLRGNFSQKISETTEPSPVREALVDQIMRDSMVANAPVVSHSDITLNLNLSALNEMHQVQLITVRVQPREELVNSTVGIQLVVWEPMKLVDQTWTERRQSGHGAWEVLVLNRSSGTSGLPRSRRAADSSPTFQNVSYVLGHPQCEGSTYCANGPLNSGTAYSIQMRVYSLGGVTTSNQWFVVTRTNVQALYVLFTLLILLVAVIVTITALFYFDVLHVITSRGNGSRGSVDNVKTITKIGPGPLNRVELEAYLDTCLNKENDILSKQFMELKDLTKARESSRTVTTNAGNLNKNAHLNRYPDILPYDQTRVLLKVPTSNNPEKYINASFVYKLQPCRNRLCPPELDRSCTPFIASQAPIKNTIDDFWQMIWEQNVRIIVMLTKLNEDGKEKCVRYWPEPQTGSQRYTAGNQELVITCTEEEVHTSHVLRRFNVISSSNVEDTRQIVQLHMTTWPDYGVPDEQEFYNLLKTYQRIQKDSPQSGEPTLVHCSAGVGRTGSFIIAYNLMDFLQNGTAEYYDIAGMVSQLRLCRMFMVQKPEQYRFLHTFMKKLLER